MIYTSIPSSDTVAATTEESDDDGDDEDCLVFERTVRTMRAKQSCVLTQLMQRASMAATRGMFVQWLSPSLCWYRVSTTTTTTRPQVWRTSKMKTTSTPTSPLYRLDLLLFSPSLPQ